MAAERGPVVTVDGPGGSGKGTVGRLLAGRLDWHFLDSGAVYRAAAWRALRDGLDLGDEPTLADRLGRMRLTLDPDSQRVEVDGTDVTAAIRDETVSQAASRIAVYGGVREALLPVQRSFRVSPGLVADGRDMGTVVFPDALAKFFLSASAEERARRRLEQLKAQGADANLTQLYQELAQRDRRDATRKVAPLAPAPDAEPVDTTGQRIEAVVNHLYEVVRDRLAHGS